MKRFFVVDIYRNSLVGLKDDKGNVILKPEDYHYVWLTPLIDNLFLVRTFCFYGLIQKVEHDGKSSFKKILPVKYHWIKLVSNGSLEARLGKKYYHIRKSSNAIDGESYCIKQGVYSNFPIRSYDNCCWPLIPY